MNTRPIPLLMANEPHQLTNQELAVLAGRLEKTILELDAYGDAFIALANLLRYRLRSIYSEQDARQTDMEWDTNTIIDFNLGKFLMTDAKIDPHKMDTIKDTTLCGRC